MRRMNRYLVVLLSVLTVAACSKKTKLIRLQAETRPDVDFTGFWELDFRASETLNERFETLALLSQRRSAQQRGRGLSLGGAGRWWGGYRATAELGQMADDLSRSTVLEIMQSGSGIEIERSDDYPLTCPFHEGLAVIVDDPLGREICGWDDHQLVFQVALPDGLNIMHRVTLAPNREQLNIATTLRSRQSPAPFTINRVYRRFEPLPDEFTCVDTVSRGRVCTRSGEVDG